MKKYLKLERYKDYLPKGLFTLFFKKSKGEIDIDFFLEKIEKYMSEEEQNLLFQKIKKEEGIDLKEMLKENEISLFKSVPSEKDKKSSSDNIETVLVVRTNNYDKKRGEEVMEEGSVQRENIEKKEIVLPKKEYKDRDFGNQEF